MLRSNADVVIAAEKVDSTNFDGMFVINGREQTSECAALANYGTLNPKCNDRYGSIGSSGGEFLTKKLHTTFMGHRGGLRVT
jgi:hypothetical protein